VDIDIITLKFANGVIGSIDNSRQCAFGYDQRLEVFCSNGAATAGNEFEHTVIMGDKEGYHSAKLPHFFIQRYADCYVDEVRQFLQCVIEDKPVTPTGEDSRAAVLLGQATWESLRQNRPVSLNNFTG
jgi:myo-inositol 2-dehydrogenase/D-chiro-inositol 1-dehydrogenase